MAKKLKKVRRPLWVVFVQLLIPWLAMGVAAVAAAAAGAPTYAIFVAAMAAALFTTWSIYWLGRRRRIVIGRQRPG
jgi:membrane protein DedA with SNARE-associated domain